MTNPPYAEMILNLIAHMTDEERENLEDRATMQWMHDHPEPYLHVPEDALELFEAFDAFNQEQADAQA